MKDEMNVKFPNVPDVYLKNSKGEEHGSVGPYGAMPFFKFALGFNGAITQGHYANEDEYFRLTDALEGIKVNKTITNMNVFGMDMIGSWKSIGSFFLSSASKECDDSDRYTIPNETISIEIKADKLPYTIEQDKLVLNENWKNENQKVSVWMLHKDNSSYYNDVPFVNGLF